MKFTFEETLEKRFACKAFKEQSIAKQDLEFILEAGRLAPSSCGFEPWKFVVVGKKEENVELSAFCFNQENVKTASHNIILLARTDLSSKDAYIQKIISRIIPKDSPKFNEVLQGYTYETNTLNQEQLYAYAKANCYLALMQMATAAMTLGIDSCMIGGFEKEKVDKFLGLKKPFETAVILSLGYRKEEPKYKKVRLSFDEVVEYR